MLPSKSLVEKGDSCTGVKQSEERLTFLVACSMSGIHLPLLVFGKSKALCCFQGIKNLPTEYNNSKKAWMTMSIFEEWVCKLDKKIKHARRRICLVVDTCTAHIQPAGLSNIELVFLPPNTTAKSQPCDQGIIHCTKVHYHKILMERIIGAIDAGKTLQDVEINVLDALQIIQDA